VTRRARLWVFAGVAIAAFGAAAAWIGTTPVRPLHFWIRDGEDPPRLYASPGGREVAGWRAAPMSDGRIACHAVTTVVESTVDQVRDWLEIPGPHISGLALAKPVLTQPSKGPWTEYLVYAVAEYWPENAFIDSELTGTWTSSDGDIVLSLKPSGEAREGSADRHTDYRWARSGDVVVLQTDTGKGVWLFPLLLRRDPLTIRWTEDTTLRPVR
jgi:hypothetical protein